MDQALIQVLGPGGEKLIAGDAHEGASQISKELATFTPSMRSADGDILPEKPRLDTRARHQFRNDAYIRGGATLHQDNIVGAFYMLNARPAMQHLKRADKRFDDAWEEAFQEEVEEKFTLWAESNSCWADAQRVNTFTSQVRLAIGVSVIIGEILASVEWERDDAEIRPYHTSFQMIDTDRLSTPPKYMGDAAVRGGIRRNKRGAPQGYYIRNAHPKDWMSVATYMDSDQWRYVPRTKPWGRLQVFHIYDLTRPDQTRGIAEMVAALEAIHITQKFRKLVLQNAVVNASYAATIESELPSQTIFAALGGGETKIETILENYIGAYLTQVAEYTGGSKNLQIDGVRIPHLPPGSKLNLHTPGNGGPLGTEFEGSLLRYIAAILGVSYEQLSRDYSKTNYSSYKGAESNTWKYMISRKKRFADAFASMAYACWLEEACNSGKIESLPSGFVENGLWYEGLTGEAIARCDWIGASRGQIDELKETQAAVLRLKYHLSTYEGEMARLGLDWRATLKQRKREMDIMKKDELWPEPADDNMMNATTGEPREKEAA